jgi:small subunit ribosomal protein S9
MIVQKSKGKTKLIKKDLTDINLEKSYFYATGRRKTAIAKVRLYKNGSGQIEINEKEYKKYFPTDELQYIIRQPIILVGQTSKFNIIVRVKGGGIKGQAEAVRHGISRALEKSDESLRVNLKKAGFLRRDPRMKERKKYGLKSARRAPQWQKR